MVEIKAIVRAERLEDIIQALHAIPSLPGVTVLPLPFALHLWRSAPAVLTHSRQNRIWCACGEGPHSLRSGK